MDITVCKIDDQCKFNARSRALKTGALRRPGDRVGVGEGEEFRMGDTCAPVADSCECMAKMTTIL